MAGRGLIGALMLTAAWLVAANGAHAFDEAKYPNLKGQWQRIGDDRWDPGKPAGAAPLTAEYRATYEANLKILKDGGQGTDPTLTCLSPGMPRIMNVYAPMEIVVTPETTHILIEHVHDTRRIHTDGRSWPGEVDESFRGYSIGRWIDQDGDGRFDVLEVETRSMKGPRTLDSSGLPLHSDNETVVKERIYLDKADANVLHDEITVIDHAFTAPWTVLKSYRRDQVRQPAWRESICAEGNNHVAVGKEDYVVGPDGLLMPTRKDQPPPDLRYFKPVRK